MKTISKLEQLYRERDTFTKYGSEVPAALAMQIAEAEKEMLQDKLLSIIEDTAPKQLPPVGIDGKVLVAMEYDNCELKRIAIASDADLINSFDVIKTLPTADDNSGEEYVPEPDDDDDKADQRRSASIGFSVHFADGKVVHEKTAQQTMIEALRYMGLERASRYNETIKGYPLVGTRQRITENGYKWQHYIDGWWIYTNLSNDRKIKCIRGVGEMLNIPLEIVMEEEPDTATTDKSGEKRGKRAMYSLNGGPAFCKNRSVLNTVWQFLAQTPGATFNDVCDSFPAELQGSYGVVKPVDEIERRKLKNRTEEGRWFLSADDILTAADGVRFAVCSEWGENFACFQQHVSHLLGWTLEEIE